MAKRVRVSDDAGVTKYTLPGNTAELTLEGGELDDTIFGQIYSSTQSGLIGWTINGNGLYKGFAGYQATILKTGTSTLMTTEAMSLVSGKTYQVTAAAKRIFDRFNATFNVFDNAVNKNAEVETIDYLYGRVTFKSSYTVTGPVTVTTNYLPLVVLGCANEFTLTQQAQANDNTCMDTAQGNNGYRTFEYGLKTVSLELTGIYKAADGFIDVLQDREELIIEVNPDGNDKTVARGFFKAVNVGQSGDVGDLEEATITFNLSVPDIDTLPYPFHWLIANDSTLSTAVKKCIEAWEAGDLIYVEYLADGTNGIGGDAVITDLSLSGGLEAMNEFTMDFQGSDAFVVVP